MERMSHVIDTPVGRRRSLPAGTLVQGPSLILRYPRAADAPALFALASDPEVTRFFSWGPYRELSEAESWLATLPQRRERAVALELAVADGDDRPLGIILLNELSLRDRRALVGTWLGRAHWGTEANTEAKAMIAGLAFGPLELERLGAYANPDNTRSQRALEKLGFRREGVLRSFHRHRDAPRDVAVFSMLRAEWRASVLATVPVRVVREVPDAWRPATTRS